ncbi:MAG: hypothetical protein LDLANPLL_00202 [Turneriella sp.]|nr:hypothetical protein [Turneriella sp.]
MPKIIPIIALGFLLNPLGIMAVSPGQQSFQQKCTACHTIGKGDRVGPDLKGVTSRHDAQWLVRWIMEPDKVIADKDPVALELLKKYNQVAMPNMGVNEAEAKNIIEYLGSGDAGGEEKVDISWSKSFSFGGIGSAQLTALVTFLVISIVIVIVFLLIARSTRNPVPTIDMKAAYKVRFKFFLAAAIVVVGTLAATLSRTPYPKSVITPSDQVKVLYVAAEQFFFRFSETPIQSSEDLKTVKALNEVVIPKGTLVEFHVTSVDVNHDFAIYDSAHRIIAQTQAMPHYTNRLQVKFDEAADYSVLCLEYCGLGHHKMRSKFTVR